MINAARSHQPPSVDMSSPSRAASSGIHHPRPTRSADPLAALAWSDPSGLAGGSEEFERDVVRIAKGQPRAVRRIHDPTVGNAEGVQFAFPCLQLPATGAGESQMVETRTS